jgi:hypothetical protein
MIDTSELMFDPDFCEYFNVLRTTARGQFGPGGYDTIPVPIQMYGAVQYADAETMEIVPEGDRVSGERIFWSNAPINETSGQGDSDIIVYHGEHWKVVKVWDRSVNGFWKAYATREEAT